MAQPTPYNRFTSFRSYQTTNPSTPLPGQSVDIELNRVKTTLDELLANLALIQRDDGELANSSVGLAQLESTLLAFNIDRPTAWATATAYIVDQTVFQNSNLYVCLEAHTSGTFATDLAALKWELIGDFSAIVSEAQTAATNAATSATAAAASATSASASAATAEGAASDVGTGGLDWFGNLSGTNTYTCTNSTGYAPGAWTNGHKVRARVVNANTGAATLNPNSWGAKSIVLPDGAALSGGELIAGSVAEFTYVSALDKVVLGGLAVVDDSISNGKLANMADQTVKGNNSGGTADPDDLTMTELTAMLNPVTGDSGAGGVKGLVPAPGAGDAASDKFLHADGTWAAITSDVADVNVVHYASGSGNYVKPANLIAAKVECWGPGGDGGDDGTPLGGGGGGGGGYVVKTYLASELSASEAYVVGAGGSGNATTFKALSAGAGGNASGATAGSAGAASGGDKNVAGQAGLAGDAVTVSATTLRVGGNGGASGGGAAGGRGGLGSGTGGTETASIPGDGAAHGGGAGGSGGLDGGGANPGSGASGALTITEYLRV